MSKSCAIDGCTESTTSSCRSVRQRHTVADRPRSPGHFGWAGRAFEPIANYAWAESWALSWSADSRLERISVANVRHDGRGPDVTKGGKGDLGYRFYSPSRHAAAKKLREVSDEPMPDGLRLRLSDGRVMAMITSIGKGGPKPAFGCNLKNIIKAARSAPRAKRRPYYNLLLMFHKGWSWSVKPRGRSRSVRVHADSCKVGR